MRRARLKLKSKASGPMRGRKFGVMLEGEQSDFAEGRDNLLINALLREEIDRAQANAVPASSKEKGVGEEEFESLFREAIAYDPEYMSRLIDSEDAAKGEEETG